jgi:hypothetical protein
MQAKNLWERSPGRILGQLKCDRLLGDINAELLPVRKVGTYLLLKNIGNEILVCVIWLDISAQAQQNRCDSSTAILPNCTSDGRQGLWVFSLIRDGR